MALNILTIIEIRQRTKRLRAMLDWAKDRRLQEPDAALKCRGILSISYRDSLDVAFLRSSSGVNQATYAVDTAQSRSNPEKRVAV